MTKYNFSREELIELMRVADEIARELSRLPREWWYYVIDNAKREVREKRRLLELRKAVDEITRTLSRFSYYEHEYIIKLALAELKKEDFRLPMKKEK